jgi:hypothetical protein
LSNNGEETVLAESITITIGQKSTTLLSENESISCTVSPNPATEFIMVSGVENLKKIELVDLNGVVVAISDSNELAIPSQLTGKFLLRIYDIYMNVFVQKVIVK